MGEPIDQNILAGLIVGVFVGAAAGYLGSLMILKRMALVGDALSHVALPGIGLAFLAGVNPFWGALASLIGGVAVVWFVENRTKLPTEALVGVTFAFSLAVGFLITPERELIEALFGDIANVGMFDLFLGVFISIAVFFITQTIMSRMVLSTISDDVAKASGVNIEKLNLVYLLLVAAVVALGIKVVGTLLMGALVVIPAAASKNIHSTLRGYSYTALVFGMVSAVAGIGISAMLDFAPGPVIVLVSIFLFMMTVALRRPR